ncbi:homeobox protein B-H1-like [Canis lupus dingo]|uniref:homeobox protein B-H1-like n=1 Tax=Canis lupus dingo TaxID=286419 RepID=UPI0020C335CA|nr:homeobox protein B-H1-like [Canis lupus dingo]
MGPSGERFERSGGSHAPWRCPSCLTSSVRLNPGSPLMHPDPHPHPHPHPHPTEDPPRRLGSGGIAARVPAGGASGATFVSRGSGCSRRDLGAALGNRELGELRWYRSGVSVVRGNVALGH